MTKRNKENKLRYCPNCHIRLWQGNCREEENYIVLTRSCPNKCGYLTHVVEVDVEKYNRNVGTLNKILALIGEEFQE
jgi:hypothetical protein